MMNEERIIIKSGNVETVFTGLFETAYNEALSYAVDIEGCFTVSGEGWLNQDSNAFCEDVEMLKAGGKIGPDGY